MPDTLDPDTGIRQPSGHRGDILAALLAEWSFRVDRFVDCLTVLNEIESHDRFLLPLDPQILIVDWMMFASMHVRKRFMHG